jgi:1-deoxy-D-xylulose-5-phosphate synthase
LVTLEEHTVLGGAGSAVNELLARHSLNCKILNLGLPDEFIAHGNPQELLAQCGLAPEAVSSAITHFIQNHVKS